jgi:hypothetical protein
MCFRLSTIFVLIICWAISAGRGEGQVWESGVVLLGNDRCLDGRVELVGDRYTIKKTVGNQVSIARDQVQFVGHSMQEVYQFKRKFLTPNSRPGDHYKLAQWCLSVQLLAEAGEHYLKLAQTHPPKSNPSVKRLGVEIKDAMLQQAEFRRYLGMAPIVRPASAASRSGPSGPSGPGGADGSLADTVVTSSGSTGGPTRRDQLTRWIESSEHPVVTAHAVAPTAGSSLQPLLPGSQNYRPVPGWTPASDSSPRPGKRLESKPSPTEIANFPVGADIPTAEELDALDDMITTQLGFPPIRLSQDPFDPEEFNRLRAAAGDNSPGQDLWDEQP